MTDEDRSREELLEEVAELRRQIAEFKATDVQCEHGEGKNSRTEEGGCQSQEAAVGPAVRRIGHDFTNLLLGICYFSESLKRKSKPGDEVHKAAEMIHDSAQQLMELMERLLGLIRGGEIRDKTADADRVPDDKAPGGTTDKYEGGTVPDHV